MRNSVINRKSILRLSQYRFAVSRFKQCDQKRIFSATIAQALNSTPAQVRKDFSNFGIRGNKKGGYRVSKIYRQLSHILGKSSVNEIVLVGAGNIGTALMNFRGFELENIRIVACFDIDPDTFAADAAVPVLPLDDFVSFVRTRKIRIGVLCVPEYAAQHVADQMAAAGITGILNFAPANLQVPARCHVSDISIIHEIERLLYLTNEDNAEQGAS